jgi:preprotein translocase subunit SecD
MRRRPVWSVIIIVGIAVVALGWTLAVGNKPFLGLDLQGGVSVVLTPTTETDTDTLNQAKAIIDQRVNALGIAEPEITTQGNNLIVQIPGVKDKDRALELVGQTAELQFRPVLAVGGPTTEEAPAEETPTDSVPGDTTPTDGTQSTDTSAVPTADVSSTTASTVADSTTSSEVGMGLTVGESAAGIQTPDTVTDSTSPPGSTPPESAPPDSAPTDTAVTDPAATAEATDAVASAEQLCAEGVPPEQNLPDQTVVLPQCNRETNELEAIYQLGPVLLTGDSLETAQASLPQGQWVVGPVFREGANGIDKFNAAAGQCYSKAETCPTGQLAIVLDARVISAPSINEATFQRDQIQISGDFSERSARDLATVLKYGALPVELQQQQAQIVSATLGRDALNAGLWAGLVGFILVAAYMTFFYRILGVLAIAKLAIEMALLWAIISWLGQSQGLALTLAGVTGLIVSIGVSVDSNVVYYEHLKEDMRNGRTIRSATDKSFATSFRTILAADMASLIGAGLLWWLTIGPVRGFALFLGLSTILDLIASYFFMRPAVRLVTQSSMATTHPKRFGLPEGPSDAVPPAPPAREKATVAS